MEPSNNFTEMRQCRLAGRRVERSGKITLVTIMAILGLVVLAGFIGNAGHVVTKKVETQNAADAVAFSSAQWMARGMNASTATNHLIGEITGLVVVLEALGGPEADHKMEDYPAESRSLDGVIRGFKKTAIAKGGYMAPALASVERPVLDFIVDKLVSPSDPKKATHKAFATIYDAKLTLKRDLMKRLVIMTVANLGFIIPPPFGFGTALASAAIHVWEMKEIALIAKEWIILEGLEFVARNLKPVKVDILETLLIKKLAEHGDFIAGRQLKASALTTGVVNAGIADTLEHLGSVYGIKTAVYPGATVFRLPIKTEPVASVHIPKIPYKNEPEWGADKSPTQSLDSLMRDMTKGFDDQIDAVNRRIYEIRASIYGSPLPLGPRQTPLNELENQVESLLDPKMKPEEKKPIEDELKRIDDLRNKKLERIAELERQIKKVEAEMKQTQKMIRQAGNLANKAGNLSIVNIPSKRLNQAEERYTQWVRATYPFVDSFRAPVLAQFEKHLEKSEAAKHYKKWTDRYTLVKAWQFRGGYRFEGKAGGKTGQWVKRPNVEPLKMYVMEGAFLDTGKRRDRKGHEKWTESSVAGKNLAEQKFTLIGMAHREIEPLFSPVIYPGATKHGMTTFAQAIFYNANEQKPAKIDAKEKTQAKLGWDTLNWDPASSPPEWGAKESNSAAKWPWEIFTADVKTSTARVKLNWQAKLMPVTQTRLVEAAASQIANPGMAFNLGKAAALHTKMVTH